MPSTSPSTHGVAKSMRPTRGTCVRRGPEHRSRRRREAALAGTTLGLLLALAGCFAAGGDGPRASAKPSAEPETIEIAAPGGAVRAYEFTGRVTLRVTAAEGAAPRSFTVNGVALSSARALLEFDGEVQPAVLRVREGAVTVHDPVQAAPDVTLHGLAGLTVVQAGQRLVLAPGGLRLERDPAAGAGPR